MIAIFALHFTNLPFAGVLAGCDIGIHYGVGTPLPSVSDTVNILIRQAAGRKLRVLIPALFLLTVATSATIAIEGRVKPAKASQ